MPDCTQCGTYIKCNGVLCKECYTKSKSGSNEVEGAAEIEGDEKLSGFTE